MRLLVLALAIAAGQLAVAADDDDAEARKALAGTWKGHVEDGATGHVLTITATAISGKRDRKQDLGAGKYTLDPSTKPPRLDATRTKGGKKGEVYLGIYELDGDTLKWCVSLPGSDRPKELAAKEGQFLLVLKRQRPAAGR